jgi:hypothetical protein
MGRSKKFLESFNEKGPDGYIAIFQGKKVEIPASIGGLYQAKQEAIKLLKVPKSKQGLLSVKPAYNEGYEVYEAEKFKKGKIYLLKSKGLPKNAMGAYKSSYINKVLKKEFHTFQAVDKNGKKELGRIFNVTADEIVKEVPNLNYSESVDEGQHYNTRVRQIESKRGSRHIRLGVQEYKKMVEGMLNPNNKAPNPANKDSQIKLEATNFFLEKCVKNLKEVKDSKKAPQFEAVSKADLKFLMDDALDAIKALKAEGVPDKEIKDMIKKAGVK